MTCPLRTRELKSACSALIVPDTCDPTWTVVTACSVPVACTRSTTGPLVTTAVVNAGVESPAWPVVGSQADGAGNDRQRAPEA